MTNPPIDPIREEMVMSLDTLSRAPAQPLRGDRGSTRACSISNSPLMTDEEMEQLRRIARAGLPCDHGLGSLMDSRLGPEGMDACA